MRGIVARMVVAALLLLSCGSYQAPALAGFSMTVPLALRLRNIEADIGELSRTIAPDALPFKVALPADGPIAARIVRAEKQLSALCVILTARGKTIAISAKPGTAEPDTLRLSRLESDLRKVKAIMLPGGIDAAPVGPRVAGAAPAPLADPAQLSPITPAQTPANPAPPRIALLIGNAGYDGRLGGLANPVRDVSAVAAALGRAGFKVELVKDADQKSMKRAIIAFGQRLAAAGKGATGLFYYAGHGIQSRGINFLAPIGAAIETEADVDIEAVAADTVLRQMEEAGTSTSIVILDACRNMPVQRSFRDATRGLARMDAPNGSFIAYSTAPGSVAADGSGANSPFATALIAEMVKPGQSIEATFRNVRRTVLAATGGRQTPWDSSSLLEGFVFTPEQ